MDDKEIEVISFATNDHLENKTVQGKMYKKWKNKILTTVKLSLF
ncbi:MAG: hypothetical protein ABI863_22955 [Ginsengibacter sp.]